MHVKVSENMAYANQVLLLTPYNSAGHGYLSSLYYSISREFRLNEPTNGLPTSTKIQFSIIQANTLIKTKFLLQEP